MSKSASGKVKRSSQGPLTMWHGMNVSTMFRFFGLKPALHWSRFLKASTIPPMAVYNSMLGGVENLLYGRKIRETQIAQPPIFILGYWRSGTTLLHNLITSDPQFTFPNLYHCVFPWHFLTSEAINCKLTSWLVPSSRPMDNVKLSWKTPQEDDVALCTMSLVSPYLLTARPADLEGWRRALRIESLPAAERQRWEDAITLLMKKITLRDQKPIVMKSPGHTFHAGTLYRLFPHAKFIFIYRNPLNVFNSSIHLRHTMIDENCLGRPVHPNIENDVIDSLLESYDAYDRDCQIIPPESVTEVKYEKLAEDPLSEMEQIYQNLKLEGFDKLKEILRPQVAALKKYKKNVFDTDPHWMDEVYRRCRHIYDRFEYPDPHDDSETAAA